MEYLIIMDVSGDVDAKVAEENNIKFIPMEYSLGDEMRVSEGIEPADIMKAFYDGQRHGDLTKTSQISPYMYEQYMEPYFEEGYSVLYLCLSSGLSSTYQSACMAKEALKDRYPNQDFYPIDTLAATGGMGVLLERAIRNRANGMSIQENYEDVVAAVKKIHLWFMVQDLMYLKRGGRVSATTAVIGSALNVRPVLKVDEQGKLVTIAKKRGNKAAANEVYANFKEYYDENSDDAIYVIDADDVELGDSLRDKILVDYPNATVRRCTLSPIIGAHTGPGMAAICHMGTR